MIYFHKPQCVHITKIYQEYNFENYTLLQAYITHTLTSNYLIKALIRIISQRLILICFNNNMFDPGLYLSQHYVNKIGRII